LPSLPSPRLPTQRGSDEAHHIAVALLASLGAACAGVGQDSSPSRSPDGQAKPAMAAARVSNISGSVIGLSDNIAKAALVEAGAGKWRAPSWTVLEKMSAGRWACGVSERPSREASAGGIPEAVTRRLARSLPQPAVRTDGGTDRVGSPRLLIEQAANRLLSAGRTPSPMAPRSLPTRTIDERAAPRASVGSTARSRVRLGAGSVHLCRC
jgi:hypothetical protein